MNVFRQHFGIVCIVAALMLVAYRLPISGTEISEVLVEVEACVILTFCQRGDNTRRAKLV